MTGTGTISARQFTVLISSFGLGSAILFMPGILAFQAKQDGWIAGLLATGTGIALVVLYCTVGRRFFAASLVGYCEHVLGRLLGKAFAMLFLSFPFVLGSLVLRDMGDFMTIAVMPETPMESILLLSVIIVVMGARLGLETLARLAELYFPIIFLLFIVLIVSVLPQAKLELLQPVLEQGMKPILAAVLEMTGFPFLEMVIFLMFYPYVNRPDRAKRAFLAGAFIAGMMLTVLTLVSIAVIGPTLVTIEWFPSYTLAQKITLAGFFERIEIIVAVIWFFSIYFKIVICFLATVMGVAHVFQVSDYRPLTMPMGMIFLIFGIVITPNFSYLISFTQKIWFPYAASFGLGLPVVLLVAGVRKQVNTPHLSNER